MKYIFIIAVIIVIAGCSKKAYYGLIYDYEKKIPLENVEVNDYLNGTKTTSDAKGYFYLKHEAKTAGRLIFKKSGYTVDTLETIRSMSGEQFIERFKGDTVYMFDVKSNFRDSINKLNQ